MEVKLEFSSSEREKASQLVSQFKTVLVLVEQEMEFWTMFAQYRSNNMGGKVVLGEKIQIENFLSETFGWTEGVPRGKYIYIWVVSV